MAKGYGARLGGGEDEEDTAVVWAYAAMTSVCGSGGRGLGVPPVSVPDCGKAWCSSARHPMLSERTGQTSLAYFSMSASRSRSRSMSLIRPRLTKWFSRAVSFTCSRCAKRRILDSAQRLHLGAECCNVGSVMGRRLRRVVRSPIQYLPNGVCDFTHRQSCVAGAALEGQAIPRELHGPARPRELDIVRHAADEQVREYPAGGGAANAVPEIPILGVRVVLPALWIRGRHPILERSIASQRGNTAAIRPRIALLVQQGHPVGRKPIQERG